MTLKSSFFKEVRSEINRNIWAPIFSILGFLSCLSLPCAVMIQQYYETIQNNMPVNDVNAADWAMRRWGSIVENLENWLGVNNFLVALGIMIMATLCGVAFFRYLHDRRQVDLFHALPISRGHLFAVRYTAGVLSVLPAYWLIHVGTASVVALVGFQEAVVWPEIAASMLTHTIFFLCLYALAIFCTILTGNTIITVLLGLWVSFFIPALVGLVTCLKQFFYQTFYAPGVWEETFLLYGSPFFTYIMQCGEDIFGLSREYTGPKILLVYTVITILLTALCWFLFQKRRSESVGAAIAFQEAKLPIKAVACIILSLAGFVFFYSAFGGFWGWFGFVAFLVLGHALVEVIYHFDFHKAFCNFRHLAILGVTVVALLVGMKMDVTGFDAYRPADEEIEGMRIGLWSEYMGYGEGSPQTYQEECRWLTDPNLLDAIMMVVDEGLEQQNNPPRFEEDGVHVNLNLTYQLKNGRQEKRSYNFYTTDSGMEDRIAYILYHPDFLFAYSDLQHIDPTLWQPGKNALHIRTAAVWDGDIESAGLYQDGEIQKLVLAMQRAELIRPLEVIRTQAPVLRIDLEYYPEESNYSHSLSYLPVYACDTQVLELIEQLTGVVPVELTAEQVEGIEVVQFYTADEADVVYYEDRYGDVWTEVISTKEAGEVSEKVLIDDPAIIAQLLENAVPNAMQRAAYDCLRFDSLEVETEKGIYVYRVQIDLGDSWNAISYLEGQAPMALLQSFFPNR